MKLAVLALIGVSQAAPVDMGCITEAGDETSISGCSCDSSCKMCGYGAKGADDADTYNTADTSTVKDKWSTAAN